MKKILFDMFTIFVCMILAYILVILHDIFIKKEISFKEKVTFFFYKMKIREFICLLHGKYYVVSSKGDFKFKEKIIMSTAEVILVTGSAVAMQDYTFSSNTTNLTIQQNFKSNINQLKKIEDCEIWKL